MLIEIKVNKSGTSSELPEYSYHLFISPLYFHRYYEVWLQIYQYVTQYNTSK